MNKKSIVYILVIALLCTIVVIKFDRDKRTVKEAIGGFNNTEINIIYELKADGGLIVFYDHSGWDDLSVAYIKRTLFGWKYIYGGTQGDIGINAKRHGGFTADYYHTIPRTPFPMYLGVITNNSIEKIEIIEKDSRIKNNAAIVENNNKTIWYAFMEPSKGLKFEIRALDSKGMEIATTLDYITAN